jgi:hypothetical protein
VKRLRPEARFLLSLAVLVAAPAQANHPLITEDTGVLGKGHWQLELHGERFRDRSAGVTSRGVVPSAVLGYGITDAADLQVELPHARVSRDDGTGRETAKGWQDLSLDLKWRVYERGGLGLVLKPGITLPTGRDERGLGAGRVTWGAALVLGYELAPLEFLAHAGWRRNRNTLGERASLVHLSGAVLVRVGEKLKLVLDLSRDTNPDPDSRTSIREVAVGATYAATPDLDFGFGFRKGLSGPASDRALLAGVKLRW